MLFEKLLKKVFVAAHVSMANSVGGEEMALYFPDQSDQIGEKSPVSLNADAATYLKYDQQAVMNYLAIEVQWRKLSSFSARTCADQLVFSLEEHFGGGWGCAVTAPYNGASHGYYYYYDPNHKYTVSCHPRTNIEVYKM